MPSILFAARYVKKLLSVREAQRMAGTYNRRRLDTIKPLDNLRAQTWDS